jgi:hypothetical protein
VTVFFFSSNIVQKTTCTFFINNYRSDQHFFALVAMMCRRFEPPGCHREHFPPAKHYSLTPLGLTPGSHPKGVKKP